MRKLLIALGLLFVAGLGAIAQTTVVQQQVSGNEVWRAAQGPGGQEAYIGINTVRGSEPITVKSGSGAATSTATPGTLVWVSTAPTTWAITLPAAPANGTIVRVTSDTTLTTLVTVTAGSGDTMAAAFSAETITANATVAAWQYYSTTKVWYRVQ